MRNKPPEFGNVWFWSSFLIAVLVALNFAAFVIYRQANPTESLSVQLWKYLESGTFRVITASLLLPIILFVLESRFKIVETFRQERVERTRRRKEEARERRWECIGRTSQMWNDLFELSSRVRYHTTGKVGVEPLLIGMAKFTSSAEDIVNMWDHRFPNLSREDTGRFVYFVNVLLQSAETVAFLIQESDNKEETSDFQDLLGVVQEAINTLAHHPIITTLKLSDKLLDLDEDDVSSSTLRKEREHRLRLLKHWADALPKQKKVLACIEGDEVEAFREVCEKVDDWIREHPTTVLAASEDFNNLRDLFHKIPLQERAYAAKHSYSTEHLRDLADWLGFEYTCLELIAKAESPK